MSSNHIRPAGMGIFFLLILSTLGCEALQKQPTSKPPARPSWLGEPIVMGGSNQEPLIFSIRRGTRLSTNAKETYLSTHAEANVRQLKEFGANFFMTHLFKAFGIRAESDEIDRAKKFATLLHEHGFRVGTYVGSTIAYETFLVEKPEAAEWLVDDYLGRPVIYGGTQYFRRRPYFAHPGYKRYLKDLLRIGIEEIKTDLIHFDNPANQAVPAVFHHPLAIEEFREFLRQKYTPDELKARIGFSNTEYILPPRYSEPERMQTFDDPVAQEWIDFRCQKLADHYQEMAQFIRRLSSEVAVEINPHGITGANRAWESSVDFARLLPHVDFFWCEDGNPAGISEQGALVSNIRSYKLARAFGNTVFNGIGNSPLMMAENLAFNPHLLTRPAAKLKPYVDFYLDNFDDIYRNTESVANVAVYRNFPSMAYNNFDTYQSTILFEQTLLQGHIPFDLIYEPHLEDLSKYKVLVLANQESMSQKELEAMDRFVREGGALVATENTSLFTEWRRRRPVLGLESLLSVSQPDEVDSLTKTDNGLSQGRTVYVPAIRPSIERPPSAPMKNLYWRLPENHHELLESVIWASRDQLPLQVEAPPTTIAELTAMRSKPRMALHFVNYDETSRVDSIAVHLRIPENNKVVELEWRSPDGRRIDLSWETAEGFVSFRVPSLKVYGLISIRLAE